MLFNSISYLIFFPINVLLYFIIPHKYRNIFLLFTSYYFYICWIPEYVVLIFFSTISTYLTGFLIEKTESTNLRKISLAINIMVNLGILFVFKYFNFFSASIQDLLELFNIKFAGFHSSLLLPVGISFYTFHALGYSIDIYRKTIKHERNFINYALFVAFFPQLVAGPIARAKSLLPQFQVKYNFEYSRTIEGLRLILIGMFKKIAIADVVAVYVNAIFNNVNQYSGLTLIVAIFLFSIQIYCDFSGYSDIAIGSAKIFGINLMENFKTPYLASSISDFWNRWHISLTTWFRDYVYIPLGGNRKGTIRKYLNIFIVFVISGIWHGANLTFIVWGMLHGIYRLVEELVRLRAYPLEFRHQFLYRLKHIFNIVFTFCLVCFAWIFFRANNIHDAFYVIKNMFHNLSITQLINDTFVVSSSILNLTVFRYFYIVSITIFIFMLIVSEIFIVYKLRNQSIALIFSNMTTGQRWLIYWFICITTIFYFVLQNGTLGQTGQFIYFQF